MVYNNPITAKVGSLVKRTLSKCTVEPLMLLDGLAFSSIHVYIENLQMDRVCRVSSGYSENICANLNSYPDYSVLVQQQYGMFVLYNSIIAAALPLLFILFMGAWSDKYGRRIPLIAVQMGHALHTGGYLLASLFPLWPAEFFLFITLLDTLGGGSVTFLTIANSYIRDVSSEESRTTRIGFANSIWFLGGPLGTLLGTFIFSRGGYKFLFATSLSFTIIAALYVIFILPESHGPFVKNKDTQTPQIPTFKVPLSMGESVSAVYGIEEKSPEGIKDSGKDISLSSMVKDFFNPHLIVDSFKSTLKKRQGNARCLILLLIVTNLLRRLTRSPYVFAFTRHVLGWNATDYSLWVTYKNVMATVGSLVAVPLLSGYFGICDNTLAIVGTVSGIMEYIVYGWVSEKNSNLIWAAPIAALLLNSCNIAQKAMMTKFVSEDEIGKVLAVLGSLDGLMPMVNSALYTYVYHHTVSIFPSAHFFLGVAMSILIVVVFCVIMKIDKSRAYNLKKAKMVEPSGPVRSKSLVVRKDSKWLLPADPVALGIMQYQDMTNNFTVNMPLMTKV